MKVPATVRNAGLLAGSLTLTLWLAVGSAFASPGATVLALAGTVAQDYASDAAGVFRPVSLSLVTEVTGLGGLIGDGSSPVTTSGPITGVDEPDGRGPSAPPPRPSPGPHPSPMPSQSPTPRGDLEIRDPEPILRVRLTADRATAARGESIKYTATVTNVGNAPASNVRIESHVPEGTVYDGQMPCGGSPVTVLPGDGRVACLDGDQVAGAEQPGPGEHIGKTYSTVPVGGSAVFSFWVHVADDTPSGTVLVNHAHAWGVGTPVWGAQGTRVVVQ